MLASRLKYAMEGLLTTVPYSLFSKIKITICEKFGTRGKGVGVDKIVEVGSTVCVNTSVGRGVRVGRETVGADSVNAGWQAEVKKEAMIVIQKMVCRVFMLNLL